MTVPHYSVVVIGTGFGGTISALTLARRFQGINRNQPAEKWKSVLMLERGTWWTTPVSTVQDKEVGVYDFLVRDRRQPVQFWSSANSFRGFVDLFTRCWRRRGNEDGLYDFTRLGTSGFWSLLNPQNDGVSILRASGVGGGSLVYSNITMRPPNLIFDDPRWAALRWSAVDRDGFFDLAREAIGVGVLWALDRDAAGQGGPPADPGLKVNTGLSNIVTRTAALDPHWAVVADPNNSRGIKRLDIGRLKPGKDLENHLWLDRARIFQTAMKQMTQEYGTVDSAINDFDPANPDNQYGADGKAKNYCERQGRCNIGCLPGARHTLNKQLMAAVHGGPPPGPGAAPKPPIFTRRELDIWPLTEVDVIEAVPQGGYAVHFDQQAAEEYVAGRRRRITRRTVTADIVIVAAGCLGTNEIMLRSKERRTLPNLSDHVGLGFSTNGDYIAFLERTREHTSLIRGPVTTSFGHFNTTDDPRRSGDQPHFHTLEDQGIPPSLASLTGAGLPLIRSLAKGRHRTLFLILAVAWWLLRRAWALIRAPFLNSRKRQDLFRSEEELTATMMCVVAMGREASVGQFRLGKGLGSTPLRIKRTDDKKFHRDPVYRDIESSLRQLAPLIRAPGERTEFINPFQTNVFGKFKVDSIATSHPLGGCRVAPDATHGVVDEFGRVFDKTKKGSRPFYEGLYIADGSIIPTALGVNPSLTISALALRIADNLVKKELEF